MVLLVAVVSLAFVSSGPSRGQPTPARVLVRNLFFGKVAIVGGLLYVAAAGAGRLALLDI
jgi:uncharacterized membrane protein YphA (DoxX/SURF4 family)